MRRVARRFSLVFSSGCLGGLANSLVLWLFGRAEIPMSLGVKLAPHLTANWLYPRLVWGGIWGVLFLLPIFRNRTVRQGLFFSLGPSIVQLFMVFPYHANKGMLGLDLGRLTPLFVLFFNAVWGITTAIWLRWVGKS
ncbi:MAG: hypothetical protein PVG99_13955 [Desulfobacteraceae bacterium]